MPFSTGHRDCAQPEAFGSKVWPMEASACCCCGVMLAMGSPALFAGSRQQPRLPVLITRQAFTQTDKQL